MSTPYFIIGGLFILSGLYSILGKYYLKRSSHTYEDFFSKKAMRRIRIIAGVFGIIFGVYLIMKGALDPSKSIWFNF